MCAGGPGDGQGRDQRHSEDAPGAVFATIAGDAEDPLAEGRGRSEDADQAERKPGWTGRGGEPQQDVAVAGALLATGESEHLFIAGGFAVRPHPGEGEPEHGIAPVKGVHEAQEPVEREIVAAQMRELVQQDEPHFRRGEIRLNLRWQQQERTHHPGDRGTGDGGGDEDARSPAQAAFGRRLLNRIRQRRSYGYLAPAHPVQGEDVSAQAEQKAGTHSARPGEQGDLAPIHG